MRVCQLQWERAPSLVTLGAAHTNVPNIKVMQSA